MLKLASHEVGDRLSQCIELADARGLRGQLENQLTYLRCYGAETPFDESRTETTLYMDFAPYSFAFTIRQPDESGEYRDVVNGGLIFHGEHDNGGDGGAPTFSVNLSPQSGWSVHT